MPAQFTRARHPELGVTVLPADAVESYRGWQAFGDTSSDPDALRAAVLAERDAETADRAAALAEQDAAGGGDPPENDAETPAETPPAAAAKARRTAAATTATPDPTPAATPRADDTQTQEQ